MLLSFIHLKLLVRRGCSPRAWQGTSGVHVQVRVRLGPSASGSNPRSGFGGDQKSAASSGEVATGAAVGTPGNAPERSCRFITVTSTSV